MTLEINYDAGIHFKETGLVLLVSDYSVELGEVDDWFKMNVCGFSHGFFFSGGCCYGWVGYYFCHVGI